MIAIIFFLTGNSQISDEEYARIMSRLDELESEENAVESAPTGGEEKAQKGLSGSSMVAHFSHNQSDARFSFTIQLIKC